MNGYFTYGKQCQSPRNNLIMGIIVKTTEHSWIILRVSESPYWNHSSPKLITTAIKCLPSMKKRGLERGREGKHLGKDVITPLISRSLSCRSCLENPNLYWCNQPLNLLTSCITAVVIPMYLSKSLGDHKFYLWLDSWHRANLFLSFLSRFFFSPQRKERKRRK